MRLPVPRGPVCRYLVEHLVRAPHELAAPSALDDPLSGNDTHLALYLIYELHYRGVERIDDRWEWEPSLVACCRALEQRFEEALLDQVVVLAAGDDIAEGLRSIANSGAGPSLSDFIAEEATLDQIREFVMHRSAYHLKEADPHSFVIPRLAGRSKVALLEIQNDEYGSGSAARMHSTLFAGTMEALGLDPTYGAYVDILPGSTLATVNLMSMFGLQRRWRGAVVGHLALFEMTSSGPNRKYGDGLRRVGADAASPFFDEHVEADAVHEVVAAHDMAGALAEDDPTVASDILFGASALMHMDALAAKQLMKAWERGETSLLDHSELALPA